MAGSSRREILSSAGIGLFGLLPESAAATQASGPTDFQFSPEGVGAVVRSAQERLGEAWVSVKDFGARGDGRAIDTVAINHAIAACRAGHTLFFPPGTYLVDNSGHRGGLSTAGLPRGVNVLMSGGAWLKRARGEPRGVIFISCTGDNIVQVNIDGDEYPGSMLGQWPSAQSYGVFGVGADNVIVVNSRFRNLTFGVQARGLSKWRIANCDFFQMRNSGCLLQATAAAACLHNQVIGCTFERMGDTAVAFHPAAETGEIAHNVVAHCTARNTQYGANGFSFDVEGGFRWGVLHHNLFIGNIVIQEETSPYFQGGLTMNLYSQDSAIIGNVLRGNLHSTNDCGISIPGTRNMLVAQNIIEGFRGQAIYADGAASLSIRGNKIRDCGSRERTFFSAILLADAGGSEDAIVAGNDFAWSPGYRFAGGLAAAIAATTNGGGAVRNLIVSDNVVRAPLADGIHVAGTEDRRVAGATIDGNHIVGALADGPPIRARLVDRLSVQNNRIRDAGAGIDIAGSRNVELKGNSLINREGSRMLPWLVDISGVTNAEIERNKLDAPAAQILHPLSQLTTSTNQISARDNLGLVTEAHGRTGPIPSGAVVAHHLAGPPRYISLTPVGAPAAGAHVTAISATSFTVNYAGPGPQDFFWEARL